MSNKKHILETFDLRWCRANNELMTLYFLDIIKKIDVEINKKLKSINRLPKERPQILFEIMGSNTKGSAIAVKDYIDGEFTHIITISPIFHKLKNYERVYVLIHEFIHVCLEHRKSNSKQDYDNGERECNKLTKEILDVIIKEVKENE